MKITVMQSSDTNRFLLPIRKRISQQLQIINLHLKCLSVLALTAIIPCGT
jgi:hypothetical protein